MESFNTEISAKQFEEVAIVGESGTTQHIRKIRRELTLAGIINYDLMGPHEAGILSDGHSKRLTEEEKSDIRLIAYRQLTSADKLIVVKSRVKDRTMNSVFVEEIVDHAISLNLPVFIIQCGQSLKDAHEYEIVQHRFEL